MKVEKLRVRIESLLPGPPTMQHEFFDHELDHLTPVEVQKLVEAALPEGWRLRSVLRVPRNRRFSYRVRVERTTQPIAPFSPADVLQQYEVNNGKWSSVARALQISQRALEKWLLQDPDFIELLPLLDTQRARQKKRQRK